jgi:hypothetical protein
MATMELRPLKHRTGGMGETPGQHRNRQAIRQSNSDEKSSLECETLCYTLNHDYRGTFSELP